MKSLCLLALCFDILPCALEVPPSQRGTYDTLTMLYRQGGYDGIQLYIPQKFLIVDNKQVDLEKLFEQNHIYGRAYEGVWEWHQKFNVLLERSQQEKPPYMISLQDLPAGLKDGKALLKSFLLKDDQELPLLEKTYIKKYGINRLFTYAKLQQVIDQKKLMSVRLPRKVLVVWDRKTNRYLTSQEAQKIIDEIMTWRILDTAREVALHISDESNNRYELIIFAHEESITGKGLSDKALQELEVICQEVPFDVGFGNIFWNSQGVATIIDTEYKGSPSVVCKDKLQRYPIDYSLPRRVKQPKLKEKQQKQIEKNP
jgi:hypothetical protein